MRLNFGVLAVAALLSSACSDDRAGWLAADWGCGPVEGMAALRGDAAPDWVLIGEFTETRETPAAVADIACNLATSGEPVFVGVSEYISGDTDAETKMLATLNAMIAKGAPLIVDRIGGEEHPDRVFNKSAAEKSWAQLLMAKVSTSGAARAVLLLPRASAIAAPVAPIEDRFAGYDPMPVFLKGRVVSLEIAPNPAVGLPGPAIRIHREMVDGFHGQLALHRMTRPAMEPILPSQQTIAEAGVDDATRRQQLSTEILAEARTQSGHLVEDIPVGRPSIPDDPSLRPELDLPTFVTE